jgi:acetaldehyde dehydrogenase/alcohol dehydrogenase
MASVRAHEPGVNGAEAPPELTERLNGFVDRARHAARAFRELGQDEVDRIVWAMVTAGLKNAVELAELAMQETGFGVSRRPASSPLHPEASSRKASRSPR